MDEIRHKRDTRSNEQTDEHTAEETDIQHGRAVEKGYRVEHPNQQPDIHADRQTNRQTTDIQTRKTKNANRWGKKKRNYRKGGGGKQQTTDKFKGHTPDER